MQIRDLLNQADYQDLRQRELEIAAEFVQGLWASKTPDYIKGALDAVSRMIRAPEAFAKTPETAEFVGALVAKDFARFEAAYLRKHLMPTEDD